MMTSGRRTEVRQQGSTALAVGALGVVFGDIGTSPLYAVKLAFSGSHAIAATPGNVLGVASLVFWSLILVVCLKYGMLMRRASNKGEGGIMALLALALRGVEDAERWPRRARTAVLLIGLAGVALFYGDGIITPAISVMSAVEGLEVSTPRLGRYVVPATLVILTLLFCLQRKGTAHIGKLFGPVMLVWFLCLGLLGLHSIIATPAVLEALNPWTGLHFLAEDEWRSLVVLGAVVLVVTGAEAFYAAMGHFGIQPIRTAWFFLVLPALILNYFGQGALLLRSPAAAESPFFLLAPAWSILPLMGLATVATIIASQAVIAGVFSITRQAIQLEYLPRMRVVHTSTQQLGQIYIPAVNWGLLAAIFCLVLGFRSAGHFAAAYGIAVTCTMVISTVLAFIVLRTCWRWSWLASGVAAGGFLAVDLSFLLANSLKIAYGGWFPLATGVIMFVIMSTWKKGRDLLSRRLRERAMLFEALQAQLHENPPKRVPGTAVYLTSGRLGVPQSLLRNLATNKVLHGRVVILTVIVKDEPWVPRSGRIKVRYFGDQFYRVKVYFGFNQEPNVPEALELCKDRGLDINADKASFFLGREAMFSGPRPGMAQWREQLFILLAKNTESAMSFFKLPPDRVIEVGGKVEL
jgi:KUP system potassium uptake protein